jgi:hypothetical protein
MGSHGVVTVPTVRKERSGFANRLEQLAIEHLLADLGGQRLAHPATATGSPGRCTTRSRLEKWCSEPPRDPPLILRRQRGRKGRFRAIIGAGEAHLLDRGEGFGAHGAALVGPLLGAA